MEAGCGNGYVPVRGSPAMMMMMMMIVIMLHTLYHGFLDLLDLYFYMVNKYKNRNTTYKALKMP